MRNLNFNIYALAAPKTPAEYLAVLDEALRMADDLGAQIDRDTVQMEKNAAVTAE
jgi:hypothetical protein